MTTIQAELGTPTEFVLTLTLPVVDETFTLAAAPVLSQLPDEVLDELLQEFGATCTETSVSGPVLQALESDVAIRAAVDRYNAAYGRVNDRLLDARGYGFDGDAEPEVQVDIHPLLTWAADNRPDVTNEFLVRQLAGVIVETDSANEWYWTALPGFETESSRTVGPFASGELARADAVKELSLVEHVISMLSEDGLD